MNSFDVAALQFGMLEIALLTVGGILSLVAFVCSMIIVMKMFQSNQTALGVITLLLAFCTGFGQLIALVVGWTKVSEWNIKKLMVIFTITFLLGPALALTGYGIWFARVMNDPEIQRQIQQQLDDIEIPEIDVQQ